MTTQKLAEATYESVKDELDEYVIYKKLSELKISQRPGLNKTLARLAEMEYKHYEFWKKFCPDRNIAVPTYSLLFGFLSLTCSLPFLIGASLNIMAGVEVYSMALRLVVFAVGFASPLTILTYAIGAGVSISASKLSKVSSIMSKVGGAIMIVASLLLLITL